MAERNQQAYVRILIWRRQDVVQFKKFILSSEEGVCMSKYFFFGEGLCPQDIVGEVVVDSNRIGSNSYNADHSAYVFCVVNPKKGAHYGCPKGVDHEDHRFVPAIVDSFVQQGSLSLKLSLGDLRFALFFSEPRFKAGGINNDLFSRESNLFELVFEGRHAGDANIQVISSLGQRSFSFVQAECGCLLNSFEVEIGEGSRQLVGEQGFCLAEFFLEVELKLDILMHVIQI